MSPCGHCYGHACDIVCMDIAPPRVCMCMPACAHGAPAYGGPSGLASLNMCMKQGSCDARLKYMPTYAHFGCACAYIHYTRLQESMHQLIMHMDVFFQGEPDVNVGAAKKK